MSNIYNQLTDAIARNNKNKEKELVSAYFVSDYFTLSNKQENQIGGESYFYTDKKDDFKTYARSGYYKDANTYINNHTNTQEVVDYEILSSEPSYKALSGLEDYNYYDVTIQIKFQEFNPIIQSDTYKTTVTLIEKDKKFSVIGVEE